MIKHHIRPKAICIIRKGNKILVEHSQWPTEKDEFYIPLGGRIEYGEYGKDTIVRELREEIGAEVKNVKYLGTLENIFTAKDETIHEIVLVFEAEFIDHEYYERNVIRGIELELNPPSKIEAYWLTIQEIEEQGLPLYPEGLKELLEIHSPKD